MTQWVYFALIAQFIWAVCSLIDKFVISKGHIKSPFTYIVLNGLMNVLLVFFLPFFKIEPLKLSDFLIVVLAALLALTSVFIYYKAVWHDEISRIVMLYQLGPIFVFVLSLIFLGEFLTKNLFIGFLLLICASVLVSYKREGGSIRLSKAFYPMLAATILGSAAFVMAKHIYTATGFWNAFIWFRLSAFSALLVLLVPSVRKEFFETFRAMKSKIKGLLIFKMAIDFSAFIFAGYALMSGPASLVSALNTSALPLFVFALALLASIYLPQIIKERIDKKAVFAKIVSIALITAGIIFINL